MLPQTVLKAVLASCFWPASVHSTAVWFRDLANLLTLSLKLYRARLSLFFSAWCTSFITHQKPCSTQFSHLGFQKIPGLLSIMFIACTSYTVSGKKIYIYIYGHLSFPLVGSVRDVSLFKGVVWPSQGVYRGLSNPISCFICPWVNLVGNCLARFWYSTGLTDDPLPENLSSVYL